MILDKGYCTIYTVPSDAEAARTPIDRLCIKYISWYGELQFASTSAFTSGERLDNEIDNRIRILQNRRINVKDIAVLSCSLPPPPDATQYSIVRAYHGTDEESGELITDLSLRLVV